MRKAFRVNLHPQINPDEMKRIVKTAADRPFSVLWLREKNPVRYTQLIKAVKAFTSSWDEPDLTAGF